MVAITVKFGLKNDADACPYDVLPQYAVHNHRYD